MTARRHLLLAGAAWCLAASAALAQTVKPGDIEGVVTDSIHAAPVAGALVLLARRTSDTTISASRVTDAEGRFAFDGLPPGEYLVALESAFLDSLELSSPSQSVALAAGARERLLFAIPSGATLRALACPGVLLPAGTGAVIGQLLDAHDDRPLGGALLALGWSETTVDRATLRASSEAQGVDVKTDSLGRFRVCGVPTDTYLDLRASSAAYSEVLLQLVVPEAEGVVRQNVALRPGAGFTERVAATDSTAPAGRAADPVATAVVGGFVYGATAPLRRAQVQRRGAAAVATTDSLGRYQLVGVPIGTQVLEVRKVGYLPRQLTVQVRPGQSSAPELHLTPIATLDSIRVVARRSRYREFDSRARAASFGHFLRADDIARKHPLLTSDLLRQMPGFVVQRVVNGGGTSSDLDVKVASARGETNANSSAPCFANIVIDGVPHQEINWIDPGSIGAMELYPGPAGAPVQYQSACGTILIWTKRD